METALQIFSYASFGFGVLVTAMAALFLFKFLAKVALAVYASAVEGFRHEPWLTSFEIFTALFAFSYTVLIVLRALLGLPTSLI